MKIIMLYAISWVGMVILAILNGIIREKTYAHCMRELSAHQLSTFIFIILIGLYVWFLTGILKIESSKQALLIGGMWLVMTVVFEFGFGHYVMGHTWSKLVNDYNIFKGRVWSLVLAWTAIAPYLFFRIRI